MRGPSTFVNIGPSPNLGSCFTSNLTNDELRVSKNFEFFNPKLLGNAEVGYQCFIFDIIVRSIEVKSKSILCRDFFQACKNKLGFASL